MKRLLKIKDASEGSHFLATHLCTCKTEILCISKFESDRCVMFRLSLLFCCLYIVTSSKNELCGQNMFLRIFHPLVKILFHCCHKLRFDILRQCPQFPHLTPSGAFSGDSLNGNSHPTNILPQIKTFLIEVCPKSAKFRA